MATISLLSSGSNARGQLATGDTEDVHRFTPCIFYGSPPGALPDHIAFVDQVVCGANHTLAVLRTKDGRAELWGCGDGRKGQLGPSYLRHLEEGGDGHAFEIFRPLELDVIVGDDDAASQNLEGYTVCLVAAGWETSYVALSCPGRSDVLLSMGANDYGNLGIGQTHTAHAQGKAHLVNLRRPQASKNALLHIISLTAGPHHTVAHVRATSTDGTSGSYLLGWGSSRHGQLGPIVNASGKPRPSISTPQIVPVASPEIVLSIALGNQHTVSLHTSGSLSALGSNRKQQLDGLETLSDVAQVGCTWNGTYVLLRSGLVLAAGSNTHSQLGRGVFAPAVAADKGGGIHIQRLGPVRFPVELGPGQLSKLVCGSEHVLCVVVARADDGSGRRREVWAWGWNEHGNLGTGTTEDASTPIRVWPPEAARGDTVERNAGDVLDVWAGCGTSWILVRR